MNDMSSPPTNNKAVYDDECHINSMVSEQIIHIRRIYDRPSRSPGLIFLGRSNPIELLCARMQLFRVTLGVTSMCCARNTNANVSHGAANVQEFVAQIIGMCHAKQTDHITVAGRRAIQTVTDLCQRGYWHVMCCTAAIGPDVDENSADSLWILNVPSETELLALVTKLGRDLRAGGTLVVGFEVPISSDHAARLRRVLVDNGFVPVRQQTDAAGRTLLVCGGQEPYAHAQAA